MLISKKIIKLQFKIYFFSSHVIQLSEVISNNFVNWLLPNLLLNTFVFTQVKHLIKVTGYIKYVLITIMILKQPACMMLSHLLHDCQNVKGLLNFAPKRIKLVYTINSFAPEPPLTAGEDPRPVYHLWCHQFYRSRTTLSANLCTVKRSFKSNQDKLNSAKDTTDLS